MPSFALEWAWSYANEVASVLGSSHTLCVPYFQMKIGEQHSWLSTYDYAISSFGCHCYIVHDGGTTLLYSALLKVWL